MTFVDHQFLSDENIDPRIVAFLRTQQFDVKDVREEGWQSEDDRTILNRATSVDRVVLTHDADFGQLVIQEGCPCYGVIRLKPGDRPVQDYLSMLNDLIQSNTRLVPSFLAVLTKQKARTSIRIRSV